MSYDLRNNNLENRKRGFLFSLFAKKKWFCLLEKLSVASAESGTRLVEGSEN